MARGMLVSHAEGTSGQVLADLALRAKVGQTVECSAFTRGAKPATRKVADGERMNPRGWWRITHQMQEQTSTRAMRTRGTSPNTRGCRPAPGV